MRILLTGVTGYIGSVLAPRLERAGHDVVGFARHPPTESAGGLTILQGDAVSGHGLEAAIDGADVAYFLIHSMETSSNGPFSLRETAAAENFARAARQAGVERIVYLGGLVPEGVPLSPHLSSRLEVERILHDAVPCAVALRASIVIGARSRSFRFLVRLVERLPVLPVPGWGGHRTAPIDERDIVELLARAAEIDAVCGQSLDAGGADVVSYRGLIERIRDLMMVGRPTVGLHRLTVTPIASRIASLIAGEDHALIGPLMESLESDLLPRDSRASELLGVRRHSLNAAIEHALREWESREPLAAR
jgi:uncharacterized protein YbjT (DUF2867 family)